MPQVDGNYDVDESTDDCSSVHLCSFTCWICEEAFFRYEELNVHMQTHGHQISPVLSNPYSPGRIIQLDGANDLSFASSGTLTPTSASGGHSVSSLVSSDTLNQKKTIVRTC